MEEFEIGNALIHQKDHLFDELNSVDITAEKTADVDKQAAKINRVLDILNINRELWKALDYSYKGVEITSICQSKLAALIGNLGARQSVCGARVAITLHNAQTLLQQFYADKTEWWN